MKLPSIDLHLDLHCQLSSGQSHHDQVELPVAAKYVQSLSPLNCFQLHTFHF